MIKKVLWFSEIFPRAGGIAYYSADYISALKKYANKKGKRISIKTIAHTDGTDADYPIIKVNNNGRIIDKDWYSKVLKVIKKEKPNIVHIQHEYGLYETYDDRNKGLLEMIKKIKIFGIPVVITFHSVYKKLEPYQKKFISEVLKEIEIGIVHENYQKKFLPKNIGWKPDNVYVLPHGSDENVKLNKEKVKKEMGYKKDELIVGHTGLADKRKGLMDLIEQWPKVLKKFPNSRLVLDLKPFFVKEQREHIKDLLKKTLESSASKSIEFIIRTSGKEEFNRKLKCFDVLVLPYKSESQSGVLAHGFAAGVPAIVTDIEGLGEEIMNSQAGIAVKSKKNFYKAIIKMLSSKRMREKFSKNATKYVKNTSGWNIIAEKTFKIWEEAEKKLNKFDMT